MVEAVVMVIRSKLFFENITLARKRGQILMGGSGSEMTSSEAV